MRVKVTVEPEAYKVIRLEEEGQCGIYLMNNVEQLSEGEWACDHYQLTETWREDLEDDIERHYGAWVEKAKEFNRRGNYDTI